MKKVFNLHVIVKEFAVSYDKLKDYIFCLSVKKRMQVESFQLLPFKTMLKKLTL